MNLFFSLYILPAKVDSSLLRLLEGLDRNPRPHHHLDCMWRGRNLLEVGFFELHNHKLARPEETLDNRQMPLLSSLADIERGSSGCV